MRDRTKKISNPIRLESEELKNSLSRYNLNRVFKKKIVKLTKREMQRYIYTILIKHPEGLTIDEIAFFTGLTRRSIKISLIEMEERYKNITSLTLFERKITKKTSLLYAGRHAINMIKKLSESQKMIDELKEKLKRWEEHR